MAPRTRSLDPQPPTPHAGARMRFNRRSFLIRQYSKRLRLFISYRRRPDSHLARLLKEELTDAFGDGAVFRDVDDITPGEAFPQSIQRAVDSCDVFIALITPGWIESSAKLRDPD